MSGFYELASSAANYTAAVLSLGLAIWLLMRRKRFAQTARSFAVAMVFSAAVSGATVSLGVGHVVTLLMTTASYLAWLWVLYRLFASDGRHISVSPVRPVVVVLAVMEVTHAALLALLPALGFSGEYVLLAFRVGLLIRLLFAVGALVLVHNLYAGASSASQQMLRWPTAAMAVLWLFDLHFYSIAYLTGGLPPLLVALRGTALFLVAALIAIGLMRGSENLRFKPSRAMTFQTFSLLFIGAYLLALNGVAQALSMIGGDLASALQAGFAIVATAAALIVIPSHRLRGWLRVWLTKHLFQHRFDYRAEWLRFNKTVGRHGGSARPLQERAIQAVADITESSKGLLITPQEDGVFGLAARWQWQSIEVPGQPFAAPMLQFLEEDGHIVDLDDVRQGRDTPYHKDWLPVWLVENEQAWVVVPLLHFQRLVGLVVLARPPFDRHLDWEDFDLLRVVGQQLASYLAEHAGQEALSEANRFDEFNRRIAFVMHDIKNLASQMSLLSRNAEKHADNPEFRSDMLVTLRNSSDKLNALLARLGRYGVPGKVATNALALHHCAEAVIRQMAALHEVVAGEKQQVTVRGDLEGLEQAVVHLVQNAIDASTKGTPVILNVASDGLRGTLQIIDSGEGMSPEFVRNSLFKPFQSTKSGGFGIGAFEAREMIHSMGGRLEVESREGLGTRFTISLPLEETATLMAKSEQIVATAEEGVA